LNGPAEGPNFSDTTRGENSMAIQWRINVDEALQEAKEKKKPVLLDFSAAPA